MPRSLTRRDAGIEHRRHGPRVISPRDDRRPAPAAAGFTEEPGDTALDDHVLDACGAERPRVLFLPTAGGDDASYVVRSARPRHRPRPARGWERGVVLGGLGPLPGSNRPRCAQRRDAFVDGLRGGMAPGACAEDGAALHFVHRRVAAVVASREGPRAYRIGMAGDRVVEAPLRPVILDGPGAGRAARAAARSDAIGVRPALAAARQGATASGPETTPIAEGPTSGGR